MPGTLQLTTAQIGDTQFFSLRNVSQSFYTQHVVTRAEYDLKIGVIIINLKAMSALFSMVYFIMFTVCLSKKDRETLSEKNVISYNL